jgi:hypothetical protein
MPIVVVAPTIVRFSFQHSVPGGRVADVIMDVSLDEFVGSRTTAVNGLVPAVVESWQDFPVNNLPSQVKFTGARFLDIDSEDGHGGFQAPIAGHPITGGGSPALTTPNIAILIHKQCVHSRSERNGRTYMPGVAELAVDEAGTLATADKNAWQTAFTNFKNDVDGGLFFPPATVALRVVHVAGHTGVPQPGFPDGLPNEWSSSDITSFQVDSKVATQRRRLRG